jgi:hypothetical protein
MKIKSKAPAFENRRLGHLSLQNHSKPGPPAHANGPGQEQDDKCKYDSQEAGRPTTHRVILAQSGSMPLFDQPIGINP